MTSCRGAPIYGGRMHLTRQSLVVNARRMSALKLAVSALNRDKPHVSSPSPHKPDPPHSLPTVIHHRLGRDPHLPHLPRRGLRRVRLLPHASKTADPRPSSIPELATSISLQSTGYFLSPPFWPRLIASTVGPRKPPEPSGRRSNMATTIKNTVPLWCVPSRIPPPPAFSRRLDSQSARGKWRPQIPEYDQPRLTLTRTHDS
jgi:hypothetical protein